MINNLPDLVILKIISFLKFPDILNLVTYDHRLEIIIERYKKNFYFCNNIEKINYIFSFDFNFLKDNHEELKNSLSYIRNNYFIDYSFSDETYENYICYIDSQSWFIIEYYLNWFLKRQQYEFPDFYELEFFDDNRNYYGTMSPTKPKIVNQDINLGKKLKDFVYPNKNYKNKLYKNDFENLKKL